MTEKQFDNAEATMVSVLGLSQVSEHNFTHVLNLEAETDLIGPSDAEWTPDMENVSILAGGSSSGAVVKKWVSKQYKNPTGQAIIIQNLIPVGYIPGVYSAIGDKSLFGPIGLPISLTDVISGYGHIVVFSDQVSGKTGINAKTRFACLGTYNVVKGRITAPIVWKPGETLYFVLYTHENVERAGLFFDCKGITAPGALVEYPTEVVSAEAAAEPSSPYFA